MCSWSMVGSSMSSVSSVVDDLLRETRYGISFPCSSGCQMRFIHEGVDLGGYYSYSLYGGIREAVQAAISDNKKLRERYRCRPDGGRPYKLHRKPHGTTGFVGVSC